MLASFIIKLNTTKDIVAPSVLCNEIRAWFYAITGYNDKEISDKYHNKNGCKPFTVSLLTGKKTFSDNTMILSKKSNYHIRFTTLNEEVFKSLSSGVFAMYSLKKPLKIHEYEFFINKISISPEDHPLAGIKSYDFSTKNSSTFSLNFISPTTFVYGNGNMPLPVPYSIFRGYLEKWNNFCPENYKIEENLLKTIEKNVFPSKYNINTKLVDMEKYKIIGFTGKCSFIIKDRVSEEELKNIWKLIEFSFYCGTGAKTTMGMGQTIPGM